MFFCHLGNVWEANNDSVQIHECDFGNVSFAALYIAAKWFFNVFRCAAFLSLIPNERIMLWFYHNLKSKLSVS